MVIDSSAIIAVLLNEANAAQIAEAIDSGFAAPALGGKPVGSFYRDREPEGRGGRARARFC